LTVLDIELHEGGEMRKVSLILGLALFALAGSARAQDEAPAPAGDPAAAPAPAPETVAAPAAAPAASDSKMQLGLNLLPMLIGKTKTDAGSFDMSMAYGVGLSFGYAVIPGLYVGVAPQALFRVNLKPAEGTSAKAYDLLARVAYVYTVAPKIGIYAEVLPGYSIVTDPSGGSSAKGFVIAGGVGGMMDVTDQVFINLGVGYQYGLEKRSGNKDNLSYLRIAVGAGMKF
jgi:hypothetical protein